MAETAASAEEAYDTLRHLIPQLAQELDSLRASLREHNVWLQRYGSAPEAPHTAFSSVSPYNPATVAAATHGGTHPTTASADETASLSSSSSKSASNYQASENNTLSDLPSNPPPPTYPSAASSATPSLPASSSAAAPPPEYPAGSSSSIATPSESTTSSNPPTYPATSSSTTTQPTSSAVDNDTPPSYGNTSPPPPPFLPPAPTREEMYERRDQTAEWLREGEDVLREYSARFAQLGTELQRPFEDVLGTWESSHPDNALPDYERVEEREELMVGGVGEVPPPYVGGAAEARGIANTNGEESRETREYGDERDIINETRRRQAMAEDGNSTGTSETTDVDEPERPEATSIQNEPSGEDSRRTVPSSHI